MQLFYRQQGSATLPPVIILHGLWGASENWLPVANLLSDKYHMILPDMPNHGNSPHTLHHDYEYLSVSVLEFIRQLNLPRPPAIIGHSMGGKTLMALLMKSPAITAKAIVVDIAPKDYSSSPETKKHSELLSYVKTADLNGIHERNAIYRNIRAHFPDEGDYQLLAKNIRKNKAENTFEWKINAEIIGKEISKLTGWDTPGGKSYSGNILFIRGEASGYINPETDIPLIRTLFPQAEFTAIPGASHSIHAEQPGLLAGHILEFLDKQ